jgi:hypothetical protein
MTSRVIPLHRRKMQLAQKVLVAFVAMVVLRLALKPVLLPLGFHFGLSWLLIPIRSVICLPSAAFS